MIIREINMDNWERKIDRAEKDITEEELDDKITTRLTRFNKYERDALEYLKSKYHLNQFVRSGYPNIFIPEVNNELRMIHDGPFFLEIKLGSSRLSPRQRNTFRTLNILCPVFILRIIEVSEKNYIFEVYKFEGRRENYVCRLDKALELLNQKISTEIQNKYPHFNV